MLVHARIRAFLLGVAIFGNLACKVTGAAQLHEGVGSRGAELQCQIGIIGGGPAGVYAAYKLAVKLHRKGVCLFERDEVLGGRFRDEEFTTTDGTMVQVGTGARRINETHTMSIKLAKELGIELQKVEKRAQLINIGDRHGFSPDDFADMVPPIPGFQRDSAPNTSLEDELYSFLMKTKNRARVTPELSFRQYVELVAGGPKTYTFLRAVSRFRGDFDYDLSAKNYLEYLEEELKLSMVNFYPVGGMSAFVRALAEKAQSAPGAPASIKTGEPLTAFEAMPNGNGYMLHTSHYNVPVRQLIITPGPMGFDKIGGKLADAIRARPEYKALVPIRVVIINQQWETAWWLKARLDASGIPPWRSWTTEHCIHHTEIPQEAYLAKTFVVRAVYSEDPKCVTHWETLNNQGGLDAVAAAARIGLSQVFGVDVPAPKKTTMKLWSGGWYYTRPGTLVSNKGIAEWSVEPLAGRRDLMLAGEAWWGDRPGWSTGAYLSVDKLLAARFSDGLSAQGSALTDSLQGGKR